MCAFTARPPVMGRRGVVTSGHYLATAAGFRIMEQGGNAVDAAAAMGFCLNLLEPHQSGLGGEVPVLVYAANEKRVYALSGVGWTPASFSIDWCRQHEIELIPGDGYLPATVPAPVGTWGLALARFGTMSFGQVLQPAIELAEQGFPVYEGLHEFIAANRERFTDLYPTTGAIYCPGGRVPEVGERLRNPDFAATLRLLCSAEARAGGSRVRGIEAACDAFYRGPIAEQIARFIADNPVLDASGREHAGLLSFEDLAEWQATAEEPLAVDYRGLLVHKCPAWTQGPVFLQQLTILEGLDLRRLGHNSAEYLHHWIEAAKLAFADREAYYGDPRFDKAPWDVLLSKEYGDRRRAQIGPEASQELRPGETGWGRPDLATFDVLQANRTGLRVHAQSPADGHTGDTTQLDAADWQGNMVAATPSGGWIQASPVIAGLGFCLGTRGQMFYLDARRANALAPRKRPRATLTPTIVTRDGRPYLAFGTPGGDGQDQWTLQFFLNYVDFGMGLQEALEAPTVHTDHFPSSFYPRQYRPGGVIAEGRIAPEVIAELERRGHQVIVTDGWANGKPMAVHLDLERGVMTGGCSPRGQIGYALAW